MSHPSAERLTKIRTLMQQHHIDYYFVPARDQHNDEYLPAHWQRRGYISGFDGSAGDVLIGLKDAYLWTDARYFLQAEQQLDSHCFTLMRQQQGVTAPIHQWLGDNAANKRIGTDPHVMTISEHKLWSSALQEINGELLAIDTNLVDAIWDDQPALQIQPISALCETHTGLSAKEKITALRTTLKKHNITAHALNLLDAIAWLFNIRGGDIEYNPLAISYALITRDDAILFISDDHLNDDLREYLAGQQITIKPYEHFADALEQLEGTTLLEPTSASWWMEQQLTRSNVIFDASPITLMKAIKNQTEQNGMREAHRRDGLALCKILYWLEHHWQNESELSVCEKAEQLRAEDPQFRGPSFNTISSYAEHGAINHYAVNAQTNKPLGDKTPFLLDSGGQYISGTTDVTRTVHFGSPTKALIQQYTLVLKGHLALRRTVFPHGTCGEQLNAIAHLPLWSEGLDFSHGTGHGVGCYLCVHEGPQRISNAYTHIPLVPGMVVSNEPGFYVDGSHGFRIENLVLVVPKFSTAESLSGHGPFYTFEDLTLAPYARNLIDKSMLTTEEVQQIDAYHQMVYDKLHKDLSKDVQKWLKQATQPL